MSDGEGRGRECECRGRSGVVCEWRRGREGVGGVGVIGRRGCVRKWSREGEGGCKSDMPSTYAPPAAGHWC